MFSYEVVAGNEDLGAKSGEIFLEEVAEKKAKELATTFRNVLLMKVSLENDLARKRKNIPKAELKLVKGTGDIFHARVLGLFGEDWKCSSHQEETTSCGALKAA